MSDTRCADLLSAINRDGLSRAHFQGARLLLLEAPARAPQLLEGLMQLPASTSVTMLADEASSYLADSDLDEIARHAVDTLCGSASGNEVAAQVIARLSIECPATLRPYLARLWQSRAHLSSYAARFAWRAADDHELTRLIELLKKPASPADATEILYHIAEARSPAHLEAAAQHALGLAALQQLHLWGFDGNRKLFFEPAYHLRFDAGYLPDHGRPAPAHPTWTGGDPVAWARLGGLALGSCNCCGGQLHNLLELRALPSSIAIARQRLQLATCLSCLGWSEEVLYFQHDASGRPSASGGQQRAPRFPARALAEARVGLVQAAPRWQWQDTLLSGGQNLHRLGGHPTWVQDADYPRCNGCGAYMAALLQLDSGLPTGEGELDYQLWGDSGIGYVFWCDACSVSATSWQCT